MPRVQYGVPAGLTSQGLTNQQIAQLMLQAQLQGQDPSQTSGYDMPSQQPNHPVFSPAQGIADASGQIASAYIRKQQQQKMLQQLGEQSAANDASKNRALAIAMNPNITQQGADAASGNFQPNAQPAFPNGQNVPGVNGDPFSKPTMAQPAFDPTPLDYKQRTMAAFKSMGPNSAMAAQFLPTLAQAAQAAEPDTFTGTVKPGENAYIRGRKVASGGVEPTPLMKVLQARGVDLSSPEAQQALAAEQAQLTGKDPLHQQQLINAKTQGDLDAAKLKQLQEGGLDDDTVKRIAEQVGRYGDTSALQNIGRGTQGSTNLARVNNAITALDLTPAEQAAAKVKMKASIAASNAMAKRGANIDTAAEELNTFADQALEASDKVSREKFVPWNQLENFVRSNTSNPDYATLFTAVQGARNAYAGVMSRNGSPTVNYMQHADDLLSAAKDHESLKATLSQMKKEAVGAQQATSAVQGRIIQNQFGAATGTEAPPAPAPAQAPPKVQKWGRDAQGNPVPLP